MIKTTIKVEGMMCPMCEKHVNEAVKKSFEVDEVVSSHDEGTTVITSKDPLDTDAVMAAINEAGYKAISAQAE